MLAFPLASSTQSRCLSSSKFSSLLTLDSSPSSGHAYFYQDNFIHPIGKGKGSSSCWSSGHYSIGSQDLGQFIYPPSFGFFQPFLQCGKQGLVHCFCLPVALRVAWSGVQIFYLQFRTKGPKSNAVELWSIISYDHLQDPEQTNGVLLNKPGDVFVFDVSISFDLYPLAKIVSGHKNELFLSNSNGQGSNYVHFPLREWPSACDQIEDL